MSAAVLIGVVVMATIAFILLHKPKDKDEDQALDLKLIEIHREAKAKLSEDDLARLYVQLEELAAAGREAHRQGVSPQEATRMGKRAAIQSIASFIEIGRMFPRHDKETA